MKGLTVVSEGKRVNLRVFRRIFYPLKYRIDGEEHIIYSDTGVEKEISYGYADYYGLDDPFEVLRLIRLAKAMKCLNCEEVDEKNVDCKVTICMTKELYDADAMETKWISFDPQKLDTLEERVQRLRKNVQWSKRFRD
jgi:hypothetical protein